MYYCILLYLGHTCGLPATGTGIPRVRKWLPVKLPIPMAWVWVFVGKGMGKVKNTHGLPEHYAHALLILACSLVPLQLLPFLLLLLLLLHVRLLALICLCLCSFPLLFVVPPVPVKPKLALNIVFRYSPFVGVKRT